VHCLVSAGAFYHGAPTPLTRGGASGRKGGCAEARRVTILFREIARNDAAPGLFSDLLGSA